MGFATTVVVGGALVALLLGLLAGPWTPRWSGRRWSSPSPPWWPGWSSPSRRSRARRRRLAVVALLAQSTASTLTRWWAGRYGDRHGTAAGLLVRAVLVAAAGVLALVLQRADASAYGTVSALWNLAYDAAWGAGAAGFGFVVAPVG